MVTVSAVSLKKTRWFTHAKAQEAFELTGERLDAARSGFGVAVDGFEDGHGDMLRDGADWAGTSGSK